MLEKGASWQKMVNCLCWGDNVCVWIVLGEERWFQEEKGSNTFLTFMLSKQAYTKESCGKAEWGQGL